MLMLTQLIRRPHFENHCGHEKRILEPERLGFKSLPFYLVAVTLGQPMYSLSLALLCAEWSNNVSLTDCCERKMWPASARHMAGTQ